MTLYQLCFSFLIFFFYSVLGYLVEITSVSLRSKKIILSRGFLIGPYLPIFGFGSYVMLSLLSPYKNDYFVLFFLSLAICSILEFVTSLLMEEIFSLRWWDYSNRKYNIDGRICLENSIRFGIGGVILINFFQPILLGFLLTFSRKLIIILGTFFMILMLSDFLVSTYIIFRLKIDTNLYSNKDATMRIKKDVLQSIEKYGFFHKRLFRAFPDISNSRKMNLVNKILKKYNKRKKKKDK